jgi:putative hemolysin
VIPLVVFLLACVAVLLGSIEAAFSALMRLSLRLAAERSDRPGTLGTYLDDPLLLFVPVRFLLALVTAAATALLATGIGIEGTPTVSFVAVTVVVFIAVFELLLPRVIVARDPEGILELLLPIFTPVAYALGPLTRWMTPAPSLAATRRPIPPVGAEIAENDVPSEAAKSDAGPVQHEGMIEGEERRLLQNIMDFGGTLVREVMTPRPDIVALPEKATIGELRALFREQEYSRFPIFKESLDNIAGFVFIKDLVAMDASEDARAITSIIRPAVVVPETKRVPELLKQFQRQQTQIAIVVDEYGGTAGLVTIEDLLEEIVGEIRDEYDVESESVVDEGNGRFVFSGKVDVDEIAHRLDVHIEREGFETVGGYLLSHLGRVPTVGERFDIDGLTVEVLDAERRRINKVRIVKHEEPVEAEPPHGA